MEYFLGKRRLHKGSMVLLTSMESKYMNVSNILFTLVINNNEYSHKIYYLQRNIIRYRNFLTKSVRKEVVLKELKVSIIYLKRIKMNMNLIDMGKKYFI